MNRRDFLQFRTQDSRRVAELDCRRLYMNYLSLQVTAASGAAEHDDFADGEPPPFYVPRTLQQLFADLNRDMQTADVLRVVDGRWLVPVELRAAFDAFIHSFARRGGTVEYTA